MMLERYCMTKSQKESHKEMKVFVVDGNPSTWKEAIEFSSSILLKEGCVKENFAQSCIDRENNYPTGLPTALPVAIPHSEERDSVLEQAVCLLRLAKPVKFRNMENIEEEIEVDAVLHLAIKEGEVQLKALQSTISLFQDKNFTDLFRKCSEDELRDMFVSQWK